MEAQRKHLYTPQFTHSPSMTRLLDMYKDVVRSHWMSFLLACRAPECEPGTQHWKACGSSCNLYAWGMNTSTDLHKPWYREASIHTKKKSLQRDLGGGRTEGPHSWPPHEVALGLLLHSPRTVNTKHWQWPRDTGSLLANSSSSSLSEG